MSEIKVEKERKFLLKSLPNLSWNKILNIEQYYIDGYRNRKTMDETISFERIKKEKVALGYNNELEVTEISGEEYFAKRLKESTPEQHMISKYRHEFMFDGRKLEIDLFDNMNLVMMEVEDVEMDTVIKFPPEVEAVLLMEVTGMSQFDNYNLAKPY